MRGLMMDFPLTIPTILERARSEFSRVEIVWRCPDKSVKRCTFGKLYQRSRALAEALTSAGLKKGDRVATLMWNHEAHMEAYLGVPSAGGVLHTLNLRLHASELAFIANHANDRFLIVDDVLLPCLEGFRRDAPFERVFVVPFSGAPVPAGYEDYEALLATATGTFSYPTLDEYDAAAMCFTSGTTGRPKGVVYSHRSLVLHSLAEAMKDSFGVGHHETVLIMAPMFHANAWGLPHTCVMAGAKLVLQGPHADPESLLQLIVSEKVSIACGVPTIWLSILDQLDRNPGKWKLPRAVSGICGGSAPPESLIRALDRHGIHIRHSWGMTETSPVAAIGGLRSHMHELPEDEKYRVRTHQGWAAPFVELRITRDGHEVPRDGETAGDLEVRGPWVASSYHNAPEEQRSWTADGWFRTGDVATMDEDGYIRLVDRSKDLIKSGGEWISSVDLENAVMGHPAVKEAAVIGVPHPKWEERPLAVVVLKQGAAATAEELRVFLAARFAKWQLPDAIVFSDAIPRTSVGKFLKSKLREQYADWKWG
jgi:fatty-acyl-CoA synthase